MRRSRARRPRSSSCCVRKRWRSCPTAKASLAATVPRRHVPRGEDRVRAALRRRDAAGGSSQRGTGDIIARRRPASRCASPRTRSPCCPRAPDERRWTAPRRSSIGRGAAQHRSGEICRRARHRLLRSTRDAVTRRRRRRRTREVHGSADVFAAPGVALAWGVLRGADEATTAVVIRIDADPPSIPGCRRRASIRSRKAELPLLRITRGARSLDVRVPRAQFADYPRTELRLFAVGGAGRRPERPDARRVLSGRARHHARIHRRREARRRPDDADRARPRRHRKHPAMTRDELAACSITRC